MRARGCIVMCALVALCAADTAPRSEKQVDSPLSVPQVILLTQERSDSVIDKLSPKTDESHDAIASTLCQRRPMNANFANLGWDSYIIAPREYDAGFCSGECPTEMLARLNGTNHTLIQSLLHKTYAVPKACCVPTEFSSISTLYMDKDYNLVIKKYENMAVKSCGCR